MNVVAGEIGVEKHQRGGAGEVRADQSQTGRTLQGRDHGDGQDHHLRCPSDHQKRQTWQCCVYFSFQLKVETAIHNQKQRAAQNGGEVIKTLDKKSRYWFFTTTFHWMNICPICALHLYQVLGELQSLHGNDTCHWARSRSCRCQGSLSLSLPPSLLSRLIVIICYTLQIPIKPIDDGLNHSGHVPWSNVEGRRGGRGDKANPFLSNKDNIKFSTVIPAMVQRLFST